MRRQRLNLKTDGAGPALRESGSFGPKVASGRRRGRYGRGAGSLAEPKRRPATSPPRGPGGKRTPDTMATIAMFWGPWR